ncbi:pectin lyase-like protein, partial [Trichodelitschia bisporula]
MRVPLIAALSVLLASVFAGPSPPPGALIVGKDGQYKSVQAAVNAATSGKTIFIHAGTYNEQVYIPPGKNGLTLIGSSSSPDSYSGNTVTITHGFSQKDGKSNDLTGTLRAHGNGLRFYNINFVNSFGKGSQALALSAYGDQQGYYACQFKGFQDTVLSEAGKHVFVKSMISGATDFIFGQHGQAWFEQVDIRVVNAGLGYITANGRDSASNPSFYVINKSSVGGSAPDGAFYLGRPWRAYSRVVFQHTSMSKVINGQGWKEWAGGDARTGNVYYGEYANTG